MTWLRFLNPLYSLRLERKFSKLEVDHEALKTSALGLADRTRALARSTVTLIDVAEHNANESQHLITEAAVGINNMRDTLQMITDDLACGKASHAKMLVDALILVIEGPKS